MKLLEQQKGWVGRPELRRDLVPLVEGRGTYVDDVRLPGTLHVAVKRSSHAHARITRLDLGPALAAPGVAAVLGPDDARGLSIPIMSVVEGQKMDAYPLFYDKALYVGQPLALVAAENRYLAEDALDQVVVEYDPLPVVTDVEAALRADAPLLHEEWGTNEAARARLGSGDPDAAIAAADLVLEETFHTPRQMGIPMEGRSILAHYDTKAGTLTVWYSTQAPHLFRTVLAKMLSLPEHRIRVICPNVGGGFGNKLHYHPEEVGVCLLAVRTGRPVKFVEDRWEHFQATVHSRQQTIHVRVGVRADGTIAGMTARILADAGAHLHTKGNAPAWLTARMLPGPYRITDYRVDCAAVVTNKTPYGAYRGFGQPQCVFVHEQLMDRIAHRLGLDPAEVRRRNLVGPELMPWRNPAGMLYDSGDYPAALERALAGANYTALRAKQARVRAGGGLYGVGIASFVEYTAMGPSRLMAMAGNRQGGYESAVVRIDPSGAVSCFTGLIELGQGTMTALAQICADHLGVRPEEVGVFSGDTHTAPYSFYGTAASRGAALAGGACVLACRQLRLKVLQVAAHLLQVPLDDIELADGRARVLGQPERSLSLAELSLEAWRAHRLPEGMEPGLEAKAIYDPENWTYSYQVHVVGVEIDPGTAAIRIDKYHIVHDCGTILNPALVEGQIRGAVAQGLGGALLEEVVYNSEGQLLTSTFMDYLIPTAMEMPELSMEHMETPSPHIPGGMKGVAEGGVIGATVALIGAALDATRIGGSNLYPMTPERLMQIISSAAESIEGCDC